MTTVTKESILNALSKVQEPELHQDLVTLNMIRELNIDDNIVSFTIMLTTPACPLRTQIEKEARQAAMAVEGVKSVKKIRFGCSQRWTHARVGQHAHPQCHCHRLRKGRGW